MTQIVVPRQFRGPPVTANGGYICGLLAKAVGGKGSAMLRAGVPLDTPVELVTGEDGAVSALGAEGQVLGVAKPARDDQIPPPPPSPGVGVARAAAAASPFATRSLHRGCFSCCIEREAGEGLGVHVGQVPGAEAGVCAGLWVPHANFAAADGTMPDEITWGALDCSGSMAWWIKTGSPVGLLGTMSGEVLKAPKAGETYVIVASAGESEGRKFFAGVALYDADGDVVARSGQIWIGRPVGAPAPAPLAPAASA
ncbi:hypothetical protein [Phenylobacterium sp.]|uniref:hypothetical protein n=1 Tax=Phenylobacterium sp. TaxID=1871053 RepID=UPI00272FEB33|nr:hypothetical protein [Phenylobacterium sp.]MDP1873848.1 hypothetical protein [Phenylobacterium sp.]MDP3298920.1 hypothetical protein [Phenylobacterium sp.]MDP3490770.1 hypothetical protein [Phenylobacterium sp.]